VAGHGLAAGVIMLMVQSAVQSLVRLSPRASPRDLVCALNGALYENIRKRMKRDEHVTFCLARYTPAPTRTSSSAARTAPATTSPPKGPGWGPWRTCARRRWRRRSRSGRAI
jgi:serine phosphatase RsbU (regulator of sigma subunit)